jgi:TRAP-type C4-dicarboxylate transport system permease large subunit
MLMKIVPIVVLIGSILGGIYTGLFTATEAGAVGALVALAIALLRRKLTLRSFWGVLTETGHVTVSVSFLIICANIYTRMLAMSGTPQAMLEWMSAAGFGRDSFPAHLRADRHPAGHHHRLGVHPADRAAADAAAGGAVRP